MDIFGKELDDPTMEKSSSQFPGAIPTYRLYGERRPETPDFWLHFETLPDRSRKYRWEIDVHRHAAFFQIFNITAGSGEAVFGESRRTFSAPVAIFIPAGAVHGFSFSHDSDGTVLTAISERLVTLTGTDRQLAIFFAEPHVISLADVTNTASAAAQSALAHIAAELHGRAPGRMAMVDASLTEALVSLARAGQPDAAEQEWAADRDTERIEQLSTLVDTHFREHRRVGFYAERLGVSPTHLNRMTRRVVHLSVQGFINRKLVSEARRELVFTHMPVKAVAYSLGFADPAYFNRFFRQQTGTTPGAFRREERRKLSMQMM